MARAPARDGSVLNLDGGRGDRKEHTLGVRFSCRTSSPLLKEQERKQQQLLHLWFEHLDGW